MVLSTCCSIVLCLIVCSFGLLGLVCSIVLCLIVCSFGLLGLVPTLKLPPTFHLWLLCFCIVQPVDKPLGGSLPSPVWRLYTLFIPSLSYLLPSPTPSFLPLSLPHSFLPPSLASSSLPPSFLSSPPMQSYLLLSQPYRQNVRHCSSCQGTI